MIWVCPCWQCSDCVGPVYARCKQELKRMLCTGYVHGWLEGLFNAAVFAHRQDCVQDHTGCRAEQATGVADMCHENVSCMHLGAGVWVIKRPARCHLTKPEHSMLSIWQRQSLVCAAVCGGRIPTVPGAIVRHAYLQRCQKQV